LYSDGDDHHDRGKPHASHHGFPLFSLLYPTLTSVSDLSNWTFDDDIDRVSDDEAALAHGGAVGGISGGGGDGSPSVVGPSDEGGSDIPRGSGAVSLEDEEYTPSLTRSRKGAGSSGFDATHFYHYMEDHFSRLNLWLDAIDERQQQHAQDQQELLLEQMEFDRR